MGRPSAPDEPRSGCGIWFDADPIVHGAAELLLASQVPFRRLDGDVTQEKLDLLEFTAGEVTQARSRSPQVVWRQLLDTGMRGCRPDDVPEYFR
jgi:hypothetical protein